MGKNYYEILEIDKNASPDIIKKAYNTLAKKYHPDLQPENIKNRYQEKLKLINEAYEILSNPEKRKDYDNKLKSIEDEINLKNKEIIDNLLNENIILKNKLNDLDGLYRSIYNKNEDTSTHENIYNNYYVDQKLYQQELERARQKAYHDAYIQDLQSSGYRIKYKKTLKEHLISFFSIIITISILFFIWQLPFVRKFFSEVEGLNIIAKFLDKLF